jgi:hypothetical protein
MRRKPASATNNAAAAQRSTIFPLRQRLTRRVHASVRAKQLSIRLVEDRLRRSSSLIPSRCRVSVSFSQTAGRRGADRLQPLHAGAQLFQGFLGCGFGPRAAQTPGGLPLFFLGQMLRHVLAALFIHLQHHHEMFAAQALTVEQQRHQPGGHGPLAEFFQLGGRRGPSSDD